MKNHDQYFNFLVLFKQQKQVILGSLKRENYVKGQVYKFMPFLQLQNEKNNSWCCDFFNPSPKIRIITMKLPLKLLVLRYFGHPIRSYLIPIRLRFSPNLLVKIAFKDSKIISISLNSLIKDRNLCRNTNFKDFRMYIQKLFSILYIKSISKYVTLYAYLILYAYEFFKNLSTCMFI